MPWPWHRRRQPPPLATHCAWTHNQLSDAQRNWLDALPLTLHHDTALFVHASADRPDLWRYVYDARAAAASLDAASNWPGVRYVFGGHVHNQSLYYRGAADELMLFTPQPGVAVPVPKHRQWLGTIGSVGQPRDGNPQAMYAVLDTDRAQLTFHRVPYDHAAAAAAIRTCGPARVFCRSAGARPMKLLEPGETLDGFTVDDCIHSGGMAHIYRVHYSQGQRRPWLCDGHESAAHDGWRRRREHRQLRD